MIKQALTESGDQDSKYLGPWCEQSRDISTRKALAWEAVNKMFKVWKSKLDRKLKIQLFRATTATILLYGSATWTLTKADEKKLDGVYTRMLRTALNISWNQKITNKELYGNLNKVTNTVRQRRLRLAVHVARDTSSPAHSLVVWDPQHGNANRGRPSKTFLDLLIKDTGLETIKEVHSLMKDRNEWRDMVLRCNSIE